MNFDQFDPSSTLGENGFQIFLDEFHSERLTGLLGSGGLEELATACANQDVFRTKLGDIKQIQNLHKTHLGALHSINKKCAKMIGADPDRIRILNNQFFAKPPNYKMTSAHQDNAYFNAHKDREVYTFWIPLNPVNVLNSCMFYVPNSHHRGLVDHRPIGTNTRTRTGVKGVSMYSDVYKNSEFVPVPMDVGDVLVHDKDTMHFSSPNLSDDYRIALTCIMEVLD